LLGSSKQEDEMGGLCSTYGEDEKQYKIFVRKPNGKRLVGRILKQILVK
jgi:hypothetical protein